MPKPLRKKQDRSKVSPDLTLPHGYQTFDPEWFAEAGYENQHGVRLDSKPSDMRTQLRRRLGDRCYLYTQHIIGFEAHDPTHCLNASNTPCYDRMDTICRNCRPVIKQRRSSPNWEGGLVTYATCKHQMRTWLTAEEWEGVWIAGLNPASLDNSVMFLGQVCTSHRSNYQLYCSLQTAAPEVVPFKLASNNPRGDLYTPGDILNVNSPPEWEHYATSYDHPVQPHTRSVETYKTSPGSHVLRCPDCLDLEAGTGFHHAKWLDDWEMPGLRTAVRRRSAPKMVQRH